MGLTETNVILSDVRQNSEKLMPLYSICITCRNNAETARESLESILNQIDDNFEIIVVDAKSKDGTTEILREYAEKGRIKLIVEKCSRGRGRQTAFENSKGKYIIANMDLDDVFAPKLKDLLEFYHKHCEGKLLLTIKGVSKGIRGEQNVTIGPRQVIEKLGGWRDLQWGEDWDIWSRAAKQSSFLWTVFPLVKMTNPHYERQGLRTKLSVRYIRYREMLRLGRPIFNSYERITLNQKVVYILSKIDSVLRKKYYDTFNKTFDPYDKKYYIEFHQKSANASEAPIII